MGNTYLHSAIRTNLATLGSGSRRARSSTLVGLRPALLRQRSLCVKEDGWRGVSRDTVLEFRSQKVVLDERRRSGVHHCLANVVFAKNPLVLLQRSGVGEPLAIPLCERFLDA